MPRRIKAVDTDAEKYGIRITYKDGKSGWLVGPDNDYLLFDAESDALKAIKKIKRNDNYSWNCTVEASEFHG